MLEFAFTAMAERSQRILSYNVRYFGHALRGLASTSGPKRRIAAGLAALSPLADIVCLQEVETISLRSRLAHRGAKNGETQLEAFMGRMEEAFAAIGRPQPYNAYYFRAHTYQVGSTPLYTTGLAILVNRETLKVDKHNVEQPQHITYHHLLRWKDRKQSRICAHMKLTDLDGRPLHVFNTHLSLPTPWSKTFWSQRDKMGHGINQLHEAQTLRRFVSEHAGDEPFVICGDFNSPPGSPVFRFLTDDGRLTSCQACLGAIDPGLPRAFPTAGFMRLRMHLDHLFSGNGLEWVDLEETCPFGDEKSRFHGCSDHVPLIARFRIARPA